VIAIARGTVGTGEVLAVAAALGGVVCSVAYSVLMRRVTAEVHPLAATAIFLSVTAVVSAIAAIPELGHVVWPPPLSVLLATLYLAVFGSVIAFVAYFYLLPRVSLMVSASLVLAQPVIAVLVDAAFADDVALAPATWAGVAITLFGVACNLIVRGRAVNPVAPR
jgi:drug/metabolite transporter (DMT)-like permease